MNPNIIVLSHPTYVGPSGATAAATHAFFTREYTPPVTPRHVDMDVVHNQNGKFKYVYDSGPGFARWSPFTIRCDSRFTDILGDNAQVQYGHLLELWNHPGTLGLKTPDGTYSVHWAGQDLERGFLRFPREVGDDIEWDVVVQFEEA